MSFDPQKISRSLYNIEKILAKIVDKEGCGCGGAGGTGIGESEPEPYIDDGIGTPDGYDDYTNYRAQKCALIEWIYKDWEQSLRRISSLSLIGASVTLLAGGGGILGAAILVPMPLVQIAALAVLLVELVVLLGNHSSVMDDAADYVAALSPCLLINAVNPQGARLNLNTDIDAQSFDILLDSYVKGALKSFVSNDLVNVLFAPKPPINLTDSAACDACSANCLANIGPADLEDGQVIAKDVQPTYVDLTMSPSLTFPPGGCEEGVYRFALRIDLVTGCTAVIDSIIETDGTWNEYFCHAGGVPPESIDGYGFYDAVANPVQQALAKTDFIGPEMDGVVVVYSSTSCNLKFRLVAP